MKLLVMAVAAVAALLAADNTVTGTWSIQTEVMGYQGSADCTLKQDDNKISGTCTSGGIEHAVTGEITDEKVTFRHASEYEGQALTLIYTGKFESPTALGGELYVQPFEVGGTFRGTRKAE